MLSVINVFSEFKETVFFFLFKKSAYILVNVSIYSMVIVTCLPDICLLSSLN